MAASQLAMLARAFNGAQAQSKLCTVLPSQQPSKRSCSLNRSDALRRVMHTWCAGIAVPAAI